MKLLDLLYIYDATIDFAEDRDDASLTIAHTGNLVDLVNKLTGLVSEGTFFRRGVVTTHGYPGNIILNSGGKIGDLIDASGIRKRCEGRNLHRLFLYPGARLYFNGCEVGAEPGGKEFLTTAAQIFLCGLGGTAFAMTSNGHPFPLPFINSGHVVHFGGGVVSTTVEAGGSVVPEAPIDWPDPPGGRDNVGNKI